MYKILQADKDTYITDRIVDGTRSFNSNVGLAGSLDLFKFYGLTTSGSISGSKTTSYPNLELSRLLLHFNLQPVKDLIFSGAIDITSPSFFSKLMLFDVYGGQACPDNFTLVVDPLSASFDEGHGKDVVYYGDFDVANFLTASKSGTQWFLSGCNSGSTATTPCDYVTGYTSSQLFNVGDENMNIDVTAAVRSMLSGVLPDQGFRVAYAPVHEADAYSYFVKRFGSRQAFNEDKHPMLVVGCDDSTIDDTDFLTFDSVNTVFMYTYDHGTRANIVSGSSQITGSNCMVYSLTTPASGGLFSLTFSASQHRNNVGIYSSSFLIPSSNPMIAPQLAQSGSVTFTPVWGSIDGTVPYLTGSSVIVYPANRTNTLLTAIRYVVNVSGLNDVHRCDETPVIKVSVFNYSNPLISVVKTPVDSPGVNRAMISEAYYSIRNSETNFVFVPFDTVNRSTRLSTDADYMYATIDMSSLVPERSYVIDIMIVTAGEQQRYLSASPVFKVSNLT